MNRSRRTIATVLAAIALCGPLPGCSPNDPVGAALFKTVLGVGAAVGTYYLVEQIK
jgi:hypothetical protein